MAQVLDRLRSGSAASAAEACVNLHCVAEQCEVMKDVGKRPKCASIVKVAVGAGFIPLLVGLLAKGGYTAGWACTALTETCTTYRFAGRELPADILADIADARASCSAAGGVEAAVELLKAPLRNDDLEDNLSLWDAATDALLLLNDLAKDFGCDRAFKVRCIDAGLVLPLLHYLENEVYIPELACSMPGLVSQLCRKADPTPGLPLTSAWAYEAIPAIVTAFLGGGIAPVLVKRLTLLQE